MGHPLVRLSQRINGKAGATMVEYALIFLLIALVAMAVLRGLGANSNKQLQSVNTNMQ